MTKKVFGSKQITHLIYGILMLFPFLSILSTCAYVSLNKNAYQSYSASEEFTYYEKQEIKTNDIENTREFHEDYWYYFSYTANFNYNNSIEFTLLNDTGINANIILLPLQNVFYNTDLDTFRIFNFDYISLIFRSTKPSNNIINFFNADNDVDTISFNLNYSIGEYNPVLGFLIKFNQPLSNTGTDTIDFLSGVPSEYQYLITNYELETIEQQTLDNTFDYSISKFVQDNDNYNIHFFDWFGNLFLKNGNTGVNGIYLNFINWYLNYALLVSVGYILFLLMLWFINFVRKILEGGNSFGHGGF